MASVRGLTTQLRLWAAFLAGCALGGAGTGAALGVLSGLLSPLPGELRTALLVVTGSVLVVLDLVQDPLQLPQRRELIPQQVFARGMARGGFRFGIEYGCGWRTLVPSAAGYLAAGYLLLAALPLGWAVLLGLAFGAARTAAVLQYVLLGAPGWQRFLAGHTRVLERGGSVLAAATLLTSGVLLLSP